MSQEIILPVLLHLLLFTSQYEQSAGSTIVETTQYGNHVNTRLNGEHHIRGTNNKVPTRILNKEHQLKHLKKLTENFYKFYKNKQKENYLFSKSWGAGGMPFNVLYTPNSHQQKIMKAAPRKTFSSSVKKINNLINDVRKEIPKIYSSVLKKPKPLLKIKEKIYKKHLPWKKYYSLIPQLFVSYGW